MKIRELLLYEMARGVPWSDEENDILVDKYLEYNELVKQGKKPTNKEGKILSVYQFIITALTNKNYDIKSDDAVSGQINRLKKSTKYQDRFKGHNINIPWSDKENNILVNKYLEYNKLAKQGKRPTNKEGKTLSVYQFIITALTDKGYDIRSDDAVKIQINRLKKSTKYQDRFKVHNVIINIPWSDEENNILVNKYLEYNKLAKQGKRPRNKEEKILSVYQFIITALTNKGYDIRNDVAVKGQINRLRKSTKYQDLLKGHNIIIPWSDDEIDNIRKLFADGVIFAQIAKQLKRSVRGVKAVIQRQKDYDQSPDGGETPSLLDQHRKNLKLKINMEEKAFLDNIVNKLEQLKQTGTIQSYELVENYTGIKLIGKKKPYQIDGMLTVSTQERPIFLEYFGAPWHADPTNKKYFEPEGKLTDSSKLTFDQQRKYDINKFINLKEKGIPVFIWDRECNFGEDIELCWPQIENAIINGQPYFDQVTNAIEN